MFFKKGKFVFSLRKVVNEKNTPIKKLNTLESVNAK